MTQHEWREENDGETIYWRANYHGGKFTMYRRPKEDDIWERLDPPTEAELEVLRDVLWRKYQRKRCPWKAVVTVDRMLGRTDEGGR